MRIDERKVLKLENIISEILSLTADTSQFNRVFIPIEHDFSLELANENNLNIYHLRTENRRFKYEDLTNFCVGNLSQYIFNRKTVKQAKSQADIQILYNRGRKQLREVRNENDSGAGGELGELLLYLFLENCLHAPKLLSKMEIKTTRNQYIYGADGLHLYMTKDKYGNMLYQFVIGEAKIKNDILDATRVAFDSIRKSIDEIDIETALVSEEILKEVCTKEDAEKLIEVILPSEDIADKFTTSEKAIGLFIGYTGDYDEDIDNASWNKKINDKIKKDIERAVDTIKKKIDGLSLKGYSFYCYYLPFNDAEKDRKTIMDNII